MTTPGVPGGAQGSQTGGLDVFDEPARWRGEAVERLGLKGEARMAAVAPGAAFPVALLPLLRHLELAPGDTVVDLGAGLGGASAWLRARTGAEAVAVEPAAGSAAAAKQLFTDLPVVIATSSASAVRGGVADAVTLLGVTSLIGDLTATLTEARRLLRRGGRLGLSDVCLAEGDLERHGPNTFRSLARLAAEMTGAGFLCIEVAAGEADLTTEWHELAGAVDDAVEAAHAGDPAFPAWRADQQHITRLASGGYLHAATIVAILADDGDAATATPMTRPRP
jgi:SAM-dependent methyltransferase